eukprot:XP_016655716.1 PREDICTED: uncharacterized protein LOC107882189 [Acyrthosiphon pisum]
MEDEDAVNASPMRGDDDLPTHGEALILSPNDTTPIHAFLPQLRALARAPTTGATWDEFCEVMEGVTALAAATAKLPVRTEGSTNKRAAVDPADAQGIQTLYRRNRRSAIRAILSGANVPCGAGIRDATDHFTGVWSPSTCDATIFPRTDGRTPVPTGPFSACVVAKRLNKFENTAPGDDGLTYHHWRRLDPSCSLLTEVINTCLKHRRVPPAWKKAVTVLIYKKGDRSDLNNWRPISLCRTIYKLYAGCIAGRLTDWIVSNSALSPCQKGFLPADGAFEHVHTLNRELEKARTGHSDKCVAWLDVSNAFGAIPHLALETAIENCGAGEGLLQIVRDLYNGATSSIIVAEGKTPDIPVQSGIRQGCPLSGILFIMAIDPIVSALQGQDADHRVLAFADDLCLLADSAPALQLKVEEARAGLERFGLKINASKCASLHLSGRPPVGVRDSVFTILGAPMKPLAEGDAAAFLGAQVGFHVIPHKSTLADITELGLKIARSKLAPWQRIDALKTFFFPSAVHLQRMGTFAKTEWKTIDDILRPEIKATLNLPQEASNDYIYGSTLRGCCGITKLAEDSDIAAIDSAFKLLTSPDGRVTREAVDHVRSVTCRRIGRTPSNSEVGSYLSGDNEGPFRDTRGSGVASVWSRARNASGRLAASWSLDGPPSISHAGTTLRAKQRREVMKTIRDHFRIARGQALIDKPDQGRAIECVAAHAASSHFLRAGDFCRFADWRFVHRARLNLVPLNGSSSWRTGDRRCRRCGNNIESLAHVVNHCMRYTSLYMARHNSLVARLKKAAAGKFEVVSENQVIGVQRLRPDLVLRKGTTTLIIDATVPFDNRIKAFEEAAAEKKAKYEDLRKEIANDHPGEVSVFPFIVGSLGSWDPNNDVLVRQLCSRSYAKLLRKLCVSEVIGYSRDVFTEHISGVRARHG